MTWLLAFKNQRPRETALWRQGLQVERGADNMLFLTHQVWNAKELYAEQEAFKNPDLLWGPGYLLLVASGLSLLWGAAETAAYSVFFFTPLSFCCSQPCPQFLEGGWVFVLDDYYQGFSFEQVQVNIKQIQACMRVRAQTHTHTHPLTSPNVYCVTAFC